MSADPSSPLRPLREAAPRIQQLRSGLGDPAERSSAFLDVCSAVEWTLRRLLRDDPVAPLPVRLSALAPDELRPDEVLGELRQHDRVTIQVAAAVHHLFEIQQRLAAGGMATEADAGHAVSVAEMVQTELTRGVPEPVVGGDHDLDREVHAVPESVAERSGRSWLVIGIAVVLGLLLIAFAIRSLTGSGSEAHMEQGIALFRSGAYADAAHHFHRYAEANPRDATPHLYLARIHRRLGRPDLAGPALQEAMRRAPEDAAVHRELGFLLIDTGRFDVAVERFRSAVSMDAEAAEGWMGLVLALRRDGRTAEAERVLARAPVQVRERFERQDGSTSVTP